MTIINKGKIAGNKFFINFILTELFIDYTNA